MKQRGDIIERVHNLGINDYDNVINLAADLCEVLTKPYDESHDANHHCQVTLHALEIISSLSELPCYFDKELYFVDIDVNIDRLTKLVLPVVLLHDVIDRKYPESFEENNKALKIFINKHVTEADNALWIINNMSFNKEYKCGYPIHPNNDVLVQFARDIASDADKLEALGEIGIKRCKLYNSILYKDRDEEFIMGKVINYCHNKLLHLKDKYIRTCKGKKMAEDPHDYIVTFVFMNEKQKTKL